MSVTKIIVDSLDAKSLLTNPAVVVLDTKDKLILNNIQIDLHPDIVSQLELNLAWGVTALGVTGSPPMETLIIKNESSIPCYYLDVMIPAGESYTMTLALNEEVIIGFDSGYTYSYMSSYHGNKSLEASDTPITFIFSESDIILISNNRKEGTIITTSSEYICTYCGSEGNSTGSRYCSQCENNTVVLCSKLACSECGEVIDVGNQYPDCQVNGNYFRDDSMPEILDYTCKKCGALIHN